MLPVATTPTASTPAFVNMISLFLSSPKQASPQQDTAIPATAGGTAASPSQIADAMIRSMLGSSGLGSSGLGSTGLVDAPATILNQAAPRTATASIGASDLVPLATAGAVSSNKVAPATASPNQSPKKQLLNVTDVPVVADATIALVAAPTASVSLPTRDSDVNAAVPNAPQPPSSPASGSTTLITKSVPESKVAFTAVLTPVEIKTTGDATEAPRQITTNAEAAESASYAAPAPPTTPSSSNISQAPATQGSESKTAIQTPGQNAGSDTPQQNDSQENPAPIAVATETKNKASAAKQDDNATPTIGTTAAQNNSLAVTVVVDGVRPATAGQSDAPATTATPSQTTAEALRTSESDLPAAPQQRTGTAQEIAIRIEQPDAAPVDLRVVERSGQVHVDVRTPDAALQSSLRGDLGTLTNSLQRAGYHAETFTPSSASDRTASSAQTSNRDDHQDSSQNRSGTGSFSDGRRQQQQQKRSSTWLEELEDQQ